MPVAKPIESLGRIEPGEWPAMQVVRTVYKRTYTGLVAAWAELMQRRDARDWNN